MAVTKKEIRDELILRLTAGKPSSDLELSNAQVDRVIDIVRDRFVADLLFQTGKYDGHFVDPTYITYLDIGSPTGTDVKKITITKPVLSTPLNDYSLLRVLVTSTKLKSTVKARKVDLFTIGSIEEMEFSNPNDKFPVAYRTGQILNLKGLKQVEGDYNIEVEFVEAMIGSTTDYSISEAHVADVTEKAEEILRRQLGLNPITDEVNDGSVNPPQNKQ